MAYSSFPRALAQRAAAEIQTNVQTSCRFRDEPRSVAPKCPAPPALQRAHHHAYQSSARQGFRWWEIDLTYYILRALSWLGIVRDLKTPPIRVLRNDQRLGSWVIARAAEELAARFNAERIALAIRSALDGPELSALWEALARAQEHASGVLNAAQLPHLPSREELLVEAMGGGHMAVILAAVTVGAATASQDAVVIAADMAAATGMDMADAIHITDADTVPTFLVA